MFACFSLSQSQPKTWLIAAPDPSVSMKGIRGSAVWVRLSIPPTVRVAPPGTACQIKEGFLHRAFRAQQKRDQHAPQPAALRMLAFDFRYIVAYHCGRD
jgi:hypothetical protein